MRSKFKYGAYILGVLVIAFTAMLCLALSVYFLIDIPVGFYIVVNFFCIFSWTWLVFGELRTKVIVVDIGYDNIKSKGFFGLGAEKTFYFNQVDGYSVSILPASGGVTYEYLYVLVGGKKVIKLSEFYHSNYGELRHAIADTHIKNLGIKDFSYMQEIKEIFI